MGLYNLDWFDARDLARAGWQVRRIHWTDRWLQYHRALWWVRPVEASPRVVRAEDFGWPEFLARDWTTAPVDADPCDGLKNPPAAEIEALEAARDHSGLRHWGDAPPGMPPPPPFIPSNA